MIRSFKPVHHPPPRTRRDYGFLCQLTCHERGSLGKGWIWLSHKTTFRHLQADLPSCRQHAQPDHALITVQRILLFVPIVVFCESIPTSVATWTTWSRPAQPRAVHAGHPLAFTYNIWSSRPASTGTPSHDSPP
jgi:hypothetical protein